MDDELKFRQNLKTNYQKLLDNGWDENSEIIYKLNQYGFRGDYPEQSSIVYLGCSFTFGIGLHETQIWCHHLNEYFNETGVNLGYPGGSLETCYRLAKYWVNRIKPKYVFLLEPPGRRLEFLGHGGTSKVFNILSAERLITKLFKQYLSSYEELQLYRHRNIDAIKMVCLENNSKFFRIHMDEDKNPITIEDFARDLAHFGPKTQYKIYQRFLEIFNK